MLGAAGVSCLSGAARISRPFGTLGEGPQSEVGGKGCRSYEARGAVEEADKNCGEVGSTSRARAATADRRPPRPSPIGSGFAVGVRTFWGVLSRSDHSSVILFFVLVWSGRELGWAVCLFFYVGLCVRYGSLSEAGVVSCL